MKKTILTLPLLFLLGCATTKMSTPTPAPTPHRTFSSEETCTKTIKGWKQTYLIIQAMYDAGLQTSLAKKKITFSAPEISCTTNNLKLGKADHLSSHGDYIVALKSSCTSPEIKNNSPMARQIFDGLTALSGPGACIEYECRQGAMNLKCSVDGNLPTEEAFQCSYDVPKSEGCQ